MADEKLNLIQKLAKIRAISDVAQKNKKGYNYSYTDITAILANVTAGMKKYGVSLIPSIVPETADVEQNVVVNTKFDKTGKAYDQTVTEMIFKADMVFKWIDDENPSDCIEVPWFVTGSQSDPSQALGSGLTYTAICDLVRKGIMTIDPYNIIEDLNSSEATRKFADELSVDKLQELVEMSDVLARNTVEEYKMLVAIYRFQQH